MQEFAPELEEVQLVSQRKYGLDKSSPWWRKAFFRAIYLPFNRFSFKYVGIPALDTVDAKGEFCWHEATSAYTDPEVAASKCKGEFWRVCPLPLDADVPEETYQYSGRSYPRSSRPNRYAKLSFDLTATANVAALRGEIGKLKKVLER